MKDREQRALFLGMIVMLIVLGSYLVLAHYVKAYSDPTGWLNRAQKLMAGKPSLARPLVYPFVLGVLLKILGRDLIFLSNLPFILGIVFLTYKLTGFMFRSGSGRDPDLVSRLIGFLTVTVIVIVDHKLFLEIQNPYRDALAFLLILSAFALVSGHLRGRGGGWRLVAAGVCLGLSTGTRETAVLYGPGLLLLYICETRGRTWASFLRGGVLVTIGLGVGLLPFLVQNAARSGHALVPAYAAKKIDVSAGLSVPKDLPVPGMSFSYFVPQGRKTLRFLWEKFHWWGWTAYAVGVVTCVVRKQYRALLVCVASTVVPVLFYSCYFYVKPRYLFCVDFFIVPVMVTGLCGVGLLIRSLARGRARVPVVRLMAVRVLVLICLCGVSVMLLNSYRHKKNRLQLWDLGALRSAIVPLLEPKYRFISRSHHHKRMLWWLLDGGIKSQDFVREIDLASVATNGYHRALRAMYSSRLEAVRKESIYSIGRPRMLRNWFDFEPVIALNALPVKLERYGNSVDKWLYRVSPWSGTNVSISVDLVENTDNLLMVNTFRVWDLPERTYCRLYHGSTLLSDSVSNYVNYVKIDASLVGEGGLTTVHLVSDAPLPAAPRVASWPIDSDIEFALKIGQLQMSGDLVGVRSAKRGKPLLFEEGSIVLPRFCSKGKEVFAELRMVDFREEARWQGERPVRLESHHDAVVKSLPGRRAAEWIGVGLGPGNGDLDLVRVRLEGPFPPYAEQRALRKADETKNLCYVTLPAVRLRVLPAGFRPEVTVDVGSQSDGPHVLDGFYPRERGDDFRSARWTRAHARLRLPLAKQDGPIEIRVRCMAGRPSQVQGRPRFVWNGEEIADARVAVAEVPDEPTDYTFRAPGSSIRPGEWSILEIHSTLWSPGKLFGSRDTRELGHRIEMVSAGPVKE